VNKAVEEKTFEDTDSLLDYLRTARNDGFAWYRGHADAGWRLCPQVCRSTVFDEYGLLRSFWQRSISFADAPRPDDYGHWISLAQHYGVPTRVLDWSESFLVALFFAVNDASSPDSNDAAVWLLDPVALNCAVFGSTYRNYDNRELKTGVCSEGDDPVMGVTLRAFGIQWVSAPQRYVAYSPQWRYPRMVNQKAAFCWHNDSTPLEEFDGAEKFLRKIVIPGAARQHVAADLTFLGVTYSSLFPDFAGVASEIKSRGFGSTKYK
jgi:hypothetical protein